MKLKNDLKYIATPAKVFMTVLILLIAVLILQGIIIATEDIFTIAKHRQIMAKSEEELTQEEKRISRIRDSSKEFLPDGTVHLVYRPKRTLGQTDESETAQIYDANDNLLWQGPHNKSPYEYLSWTKQIRSYGEGFTQQRAKNIQMFTPEFSRTLEIPVQSDEKTIQIWRYNPAGEFFIGYDNSGTKIGYISSKGFTDSKSKVKPLGKFKLFTAWCPQASFSPTLMWQTQRRIYQIDFEKQKVEMLFESTDADIGTIRLHAWRDLKASTKEFFDAKKYRPLLHCVTKDGKHHLIMREPEQRLTVTIPKDWEGWTGNQHRFTATRQHIFLYRYWIESSAPPDRRKSLKLFQQWWRNFRSRPRKIWVELYKVNNQSNLELLNRYTWTEPALSETVIKTWDFRTPAKRFVSKFSTPLYDLAWYLISKAFWVSAYQENEIIGAFAQALPHIRPYGSIINWLLSAAMTVFTFWHGWLRRTSRLKFLFWLAFVAVFNLAGLLTYLALNHTAVIKCSACGKRRGLNQVSCVRCGTELPRPKREKLDLIALPQTFNT
jgi:hypothetical protein